MFSSIKKTQNLNNSELGTGETLFEFLKRKKKGTAEGSHNKSIHKKNKSLMSSYADLSAMDMIDAETDLGLTQRKKQKLDITPKKVTFAEEESQKKGGKTFIQMISPMKRRSSIGYYAENISETIPTQRQSKSNKKNPKQTFTRKNLNQSVSILKETLQSLIAQGQQIKQKSHALAVELRPILKYVEEGSNKNFAGRAEKAKQKLRLFEYAFKQFEIQDVNEKLEIFHRNLSQHIVSAQASIRSDFEKQGTNTVIRLKDQSESKIHELQGQKKNLLHKVDILERKLQKLQRKSLIEIEEQQDKIQSLRQISQNQMTHYKQKIRCLEEQNQILNDTIKQVRMRQKQLEKQLKDAQYTKQEMHKRMVEENQKVKSAKQQFLLNEISMIKSEFQNDMRQLATLYTNKENEQVIVIEELKKQIIELKEVRQTDRQHEKIINTESDSLRVQVYKYKKQNQCLVTDLHRMNQELYQHWLALKDIKVLSKRLHLMDRFERIYQDIPYNDQLFS